jgi:hypothetical protein
MSPSEFLRTIYLGDRGCRRIAIDGWNRRVVFEVTCISRIRSASGHWDYYTAEDIENGLIVLTGAQSIRFDPAGPIPNDFISEFSVEHGVPGDPDSIFRLSVGSVDSRAHNTEVHIEVRAKGVHLEDPRYPGKEITE